VRPFTIIPPAECLAFVAICLLHSLLANLPLAVRANARRSCSTTRTAMTGIWVFVKLARFGAIVAFLVESWHSIHQLSSVERGFSHVWAGFSFIKIDWVLQIFDNGYFKNLACLCCRNLQLCGNRFCMLALIQDRQRRVTTRSISSSTTGQPLQLRPLLYSYSCAQ
jgi:hypothetical protein